MDISENRNAPSPAETVVAVDPDATSTAFTLAPGILAPVASSTKPEIDPFTTCPYETAANRRRDTPADKTLKKFRLIILLPPLQTFLSQGNFRTQRSTCKFRLGHLPEAKANLSLSIIRFQTQNQTLQKNQASGLHILKIPLWKQQLNLQTRHYT